MTMKQHRITCHLCGNNRRFLEIAENVRKKTLFQQADDLTFSILSEESKVKGGVTLLCAECENDLTPLYDSFLEQLL